MRRATTGALAAGTLVAMTAAAAAKDVAVVTSGGFTAAYTELSAGCEAATGATLKTSLGSSMGGAPDSIPSRLARREPVDIVIMARPALDGLVKGGQAVAGSEVDLARSTIAMAVKAGAPKPDISTVEAFKRALLDAKSIAYSASASGTYLSEQAFPKLGIWDQISSKSKKIFSERVGTIVARGEAEIGFQQTSELIPIAGIEIVGQLPPEIQQTTVFSAGVAAGAQEPEAARAIIACLSSPKAAPVISKTGLDPVTK
jgi:molybdate transport system substrate-binding protein